MMKILLATDGSESATSALAFMLRLPLPADTEIRLLTVIDKAFYYSKRKKELSSEQRQLLEETKRMLRDEAEDLLAEGEARLIEAGWPVSTQILTGHPSKQIVRVAKEIAADLIVVGSHGLTGIKHFLLGSVSDKLLDHAPCSVLVVKPHASTSTVTGASDERLKFLLAYDDSPSARLAVTFCTALPLSDAVEVNILTVLPLVKLYRQDIKQRLSWVWKEKKKLAAKALEQLRTEVAWKTSHITTELREAEDVSHEILYVAGDNHSDLIVLGSKGKSAIKQFLVGTVTKRVAHHAGCSILVVRGTMAQG